MKRSSLIAIFLLIVLTLFSVIGCNRDTKSKEERVSEFLSDLNANDWTSLYTHIHPDNGFRNTAKSQDTWNPDPFANGTSFSRTSYSESGSTVTVGIDSSDNFYDGTWTFSMKEDTKDLWYINGLSIPTEGTIF